MSALHRARRSTSKTAPETGTDIAEPNGAILASTTGSFDPSLAPSLPQAPARIPEVDTEMDHVTAAAMLSAIPSTDALVPESLTESGDAALGGMDHPADSRSSSLSELGDASDVGDEPTPRAPATADLTENESEAETERLDNTPRRLNRTGTATSLASEQLYERTPSKLAHFIAADEDESAPASPTPALEEQPHPTSGSAALDTLSFLAASEAVSLELAGKKRKRSSAEDAVNEPTDEPARKRSSITKDQALNGQEDATHNAEEAEMEEELDHAEDRISALHQEGTELDTRQAEVASETVTELATVAKLTKPRKGRGRGKRKVDSSITVEAAVAEAHEGPGDADNDEEDSSSLDEESAKKKAAIDGLAKIEKKFKIFREKMCDEQLAQCERELEALKQPNCIHPEYLAAMQCVDERRANKIAYERELMKHKLECLERQTIAQRHQLHSQYFQTVRDVREKILAECNQRFFELQRGRRQLGADEVEYAIRVPEKRSEQLRQQRAYNLEVSILSGVAKYVGFPAAPDIRPARPSEVDEDLRAMKIITRPPPQPIPYVRPTYTRNITADEVAAEEQFIEKTPWANPHHPANQHQHYPAAMGPARPPPNQPYQTPAGQRRIVDIHAPNGSASTIDALSNPPSSTNAPAVQTNGHGRMAESLSPVLQMKRNPSDHVQYHETPPTIPRHFAGMARDPYGPAGHVLLSPAGEMRMEENSGPAPRWTPLNAAAPPPLPQNVASQVPLGQRSGMGTVSVGSGAGLFSR